jgi:hypothetical protein
VLVQPASGAAQSSSPRLCSAPISWRSAVTRVQSWGHQARRACWRQSRSSAWQPATAIWRRVAASSPSVRSLGRIADSLIRLGRLGLSWKAQALACRSRSKTMSVRPRSHAQSRSASMRPGFRAHGSVMARSWANSQNGHICHLTSSADGGYRGAPGSDASPWPRRVECSGWVRWGGMA